MIAPAAYSHHVGLVHYLAIPHTLDDGKTSFPADGDLRLDTVVPVGESRVLPPLGVYLFTSHVIGKTLVDAQNQSYYRRLSYRDGRRA